MISLKVSFSSDYDIEGNSNNKKETLLVFFKTDDIGNVINKLKKLIKINYDRRTNMLVLEITSTYPNIATQILNNTVSQINYFYNYQFNSNSMRNLAFVEKNITLAKTELEEAKYNLAIFIERNKQLKVALKNKDQYPEYYQCIEAMEKLEEIVNLKRKSYTALMTKREGLKLEISENAPSVTVIEAARSSIAADSREIYQEYDSQHDYWTGVLPLHISFSVTLFLFLTWQAHLLRIFLLNLKKI